VSCRVIRPLISAYLDHQLNPTQMHLVEEHLTYCARCDEEYQAVRDAKYALRSLAARSPDELAMRIAARLHAESERPQMYGQAPLPAGLISTRRTVTAAAFSCMCLFLVAVPFAPATLERYETWRNAHSPGPRDMFGTPLLTRSGFFPNKTATRPTSMTIRWRRYPSGAQVRTVTWSWNGFGQQPVRGLAQPVGSVRYIGDFTGDTDPDWVTSPR
jgi:hypothetical protein